MPRATDSKTAKQRLQARALYENGQHTQAEIAKIAGVDRKTLRKWIIEDPKDIWQRGLSSEIYSIEKAAQKNKVLREFKTRKEKVKHDVLLKQAKIDARKEASEILDLVAERNKLARITLDSYHKTRERLDQLIALKAVESETVEDVIWQGKKVPNAQKVTTRHETHDIGDLVKANALNLAMLQNLQVFGQGDNGLQGRTSSDAPIKLDAEIERKIVNIINQEPSFVTLEGSYDEMDNNNVNNL